MDAENNDGDVVAQFYKRRRDLMLLSVVILITNVLPIEFKKFNLLGSEVDIKQPYFVPIFMVIVLIYFVIRYFQYLYDIPDTGYADRRWKFKYAYFSKVMRRRTDWRKSPAIVSKFPILSNVSESNFQLLPPERPRRFEFTLSSPEFPEGLRVEGDISLIDRAIEEVAAWTFLTLRTRYVSDYIFPVLLAFAATITYLPWFKLS